MSDYLDGTSGDKVTPHKEDLEEFLMHAVEEDPRFCSGTAGSESDNVLDFIQMSGLAGPADPSPKDASMSFEQDFESPSLEQISFFEEGVGDVDSSMDPISPITPDLVTPGMAYHDQEFETSDSNSILGLEEIISELRDDSSEATDRSKRSDSLVDVSVLGIAEEPPSENLGRHAEANSSTISMVENEIDVALEDDPDQLYLGDVTTEPISDREAEEQPDDEGRSDHSFTFGELAEARSLLDRLDIGKAVDGKQAPAPTTEGLDSTSDSLPIESSADFDIEKRHSAPRRSRQRRKRNMMRWFLRVMMFAVIGGAGYGAFQFYISQTESPGAAYRAAEKMLGKGRYVRASTAFQAFTRRFPTDIRRPDAMFMAGYAMQLTPAAPHENARKSFDEALAILEGFIVEYPDHAKTARAETLMGVLYFKQDRFAEAISLLGDPERRLRDTGAYLTTLRTLGRAYAATSRIENAHSAFMRAASLEENISPDQDYVELASLYQKLAERSATEEGKRQYFERAIEQWNYALRVPGLLNSRKEDVRLRRDVVASRLEGNFAVLGEDAADFRLLSTSGTQRSTGKDDRHEVSSQSEGF